MYRYIGYMNLTKSICFFLEYTSPLWLIWLMWWSLCWGQVGQIRYESDTPDANYIYDSWAFSPSNVYSELSLITIHNHLSTYSLLINAMALRHISLSSISLFYLPFVTIESWEEVQSCAWWRIEICSSSQPSQKNSWCL